MSKHLVLDNKKYFSAQAAGKAVGYTSDYVGKLCREGNISCRRIGRSWFVEENSLNEFALIQEKEREARKEELSRQRKEEYQAQVTETSVVETPTEPETQEQQSSKTTTEVNNSPFGAIASDYVYTGPITEGRLEQPVTGTYFRKKIVEEEAKTKQTQSLVPRMPMVPANTFKEFANKTVALVTAITLVFGTYTVVDAQHFGYALRILERSVEGASRVAWSVPDTIVSMNEEFSASLVALDNFASQPAASILGHNMLAQVSAVDLAETVYTSVNEFFYNVTTQLRPTSTVVTSGNGRGRVEVSVRGVTQVNPDGASGAAELNVRSSEFLYNEESDAPSVVEQTIINQPVIERTIERVVTEPGLTLAQLQETENELRKEIARISTANSGDVTNVFRNIALTQKIDNLGDVDISNSRITSSTVAASSLSVSGSTTFDGGVTFNSTTTFTSPITSSDLTLTGDLAVNGGDVTTTATSWNFDVADTGTIQFRDGTNTLFTITDQGTTGDATISGDLTVAGDDITLGTNTSGFILVADGTNFNPVAVSGDVTISATGTVAIADDVINFSDISDSLELDASTDIAVDGTEVFSITNTGTGNSLVVNDATSDTSPFVIDNAGNVGVGTASPEASVHAVYSNTGQPRGLVSDNIGDFVNSGTVLLRKARGTVASPTAVLSGDSIGNVSFAGRDGNGYQSHQAIIQAWAAENFVYDTNYGTDLTIQLVKKNTGYTPYESARFTSEGYLGLGTASPDTNLHVNAGGNNAGILVESSDAYSGVALKDNTTSAAIGLALSRVGDNLSLYTSDTERVVVDASGNVGVGTTTPAYKLDVEGTLGASGLATFESGVNVNSETITDFTGTGLQLSSGALQTTLGTSIDISDETNLAAGTNITLSGDTLNVDDAFLLNTGDTASGDYNFDSNTLVVDSTDSRVGIGTTNPLAALQVGTTVNSINEGSPSAYITSSGTTRLGINSDTNNAGFGLYESGTLRYSIASYSGGNFTIYDDVANTDRLAISSSGNVTIGSDLTVSGGDITLGTTSIFSGGDTASLNNIDAINATTESTIEAAIDTLANLTSASSLATIGTITSGTWNGTAIDVSDYTNLAAGTGATLTGDTISVDLGTSISAGEVDADSLNFTELSDTLAVDATTTFDLDTAGADLNFDSNTLVIDSSANNIGIGTNTPTAKLTVSELLQVQGDATPQFPSAGAGVEIGYDSDVTTYGGGTAGAGIIQSFDRDSVNYETLFISAYDIGLYAGGTSNLGVFVDNAGDVGIGTKTPGTKFHVSGTSTLPIIVTGGDTITEFAGTGLTVTGNALTATLGTDISAAEIADGDHGDFTYSSGTATIDANAVALGTDTTGNYVATLADAGNSFFTVTGSGSESAAVTIDVANDSLNFAQLSDALVVDATTTVDLDTNAADLNFDSNTLVIDSSADRVGIGTASPISNLHLSESTGPIQMFMTTDTTGHTTGDGLRLRMEDSGFVSLGTMDNVGFGIYTNGSEQIRVSASGNVGIGSSTPTDTLSVIGSARFGSGPATAPTTAAASLTSGATSFGVVTIIGSTAEFPKAGTFLMGTEIIGYTDRDSSFGTLTRGMYGTTAQTHAPGTEIVPVLQVTAISDSAARMVVLGDGRVGIGTVTPSASYKLDVAGTLRATGLGTFDSGLSVNSETVTDFSGTGITVTGNALTATLGTSVDISDESNLAVGNGITLTDDTLTVTAAGGLAQAAGGLTTTGVLEDLNTLGAPASDSEFLVATGAGAFAYESGATARTSLGLGSLATLSSIDISDNTNLAVTAPITLTGDTLGFNTATSLAITGDYDFGSGTFQVPNSTTLPATCEVGDIYFDTDATTGQRLYGCQATNTWVLQGDGATIAADSLDFTDFADAMAVDATTTFDLDTAGADLNFDSNTLVIDSSANSVGIGTTSPGADLEVDAGTGSLAQILRADGGPILRFEDDGESLYWDITAAGGGTDLVFSHETLGEALRIQGSSGDVGIGDSTPDGKLDVAGDLHIGDGTAGANSQFYISADKTWQFFPDAGHMYLKRGTDLTDGWFYFGNNSSVYNAGISMLDGDAYFNGNVGIGTTTPAYKLDVAGTLRTTGLGTFDSGLSVNSETVTDFSGTGITVTGNALTAVLGTTIEGSEITNATITGAKIATGTITGSNIQDATITTAKLSIADGLNFTEFSDSLVVDATTTFDLDTNATDLNFDSNTFVIDSSANRVGIGTAAPSTKLTIQSATQYDGLSLRDGTGGLAASLIGFAADNDTGGLDLYDGGTLNVRINSSSAVSSYINAGDVGIGVTDPDKRLEVFETVADAQLKLSYDATRYTNFQTNSVGDLVIDAQGGDMFLNDESLWVCTGGSCPAGTPAATGSLTVETNIGIGAVPDSGADLEFSNGVGAGSFDGYDDYKILLYDTGSATTSYGVGIESGTLAFNTDIEYDFYIDGATTAEVNISNSTSTFQGDIVIAGKLDVDTIDPVYTIDGVKYATYGHSTIGIKEEMTAIITMETINESSGYYEHAVAFSELAEGTDLWLFYQVSSFGDEWDKLAVSLTPSFDGKVFYEKDTTTNTLHIKSTQKGEVSLRLIADRYDAVEWPNLREDQGVGHPGHVIKGKY